MCRPNLGANIRPRRHLCRLVLYHDRGISIKCLQTVLNTSKYPDWNTFCRRVIIENAPPTFESDPGTPPELRQFAELPEHHYRGITFQLEVQMSASEAPTMASLAVSVLEKFVRAGRMGYRVAWTMRGSQHWLLHSERVQEFVAPKDGNHTEYFY